MFGVLGRFRRRRGSLDHNIWRVSEKRHQEHNCCYSRLLRIYLQVKISAICLTVCIVRSSPLEGYPYLRSNYFLKISPILFDILTQTMLTVGHHFTRSSIGHTTSEMNDLGRSCSFGLPCVSFIKCCQFMYLVISLLVLRAGYGIWLYQFLIIAYLFTFQTWKSDQCLQCSLCITEISENISPGSL